jgi:hypothetical protein
MLEAYATTLQQDQRELADLKSDAVVDWNAQPATYHKLMALILCIGEKRILTEALRRVEEMQAALDSSSDTLQFATTAQRAEDTD